MTSQKIALGIDLGTTNSCVGVFRNGKVEIIPNDFGDKITPSIVAFTEKGILVGKAAKLQIIKNPSNTIYNSKRFIGKKITDKEIKKELKLYPVQIEKNNKNNKILFSIIKDGKKENKSPEEILSIILLKLKSFASIYLKELKEEIKDAIITVPASFNDSQRQSIKDAGKIAGLNILRIINEPTAAGIAYRFNIKKNLNKKQKVIVFDLGGGTFDISILEIENDSIDVKATKGDNNFGGVDFDNLLTEYCIKDFNNQYNIDLKSNPLAVRRLKNACEKLKIDLSSNLESTINLDYLMNMKDFEKTITRSDFEDICKDLFEKCKKTLEQILQENKIDKKKIDEIILVGGGTKIPKISKIIQEIFKDKKLNNYMNQEEAVAYGAAIQAAKINGMKAQNLNDFLLLDVIPLSLGIASHGNKMNVIIPKYSPIPLEKKKIFTTNRDYQKDIKIHVYEGEYEDLSRNHKLGGFKLNNLPEKKKGEVEVEVIFNVDVNSILSVNAIVKNSQIKEKITLINDKDNLTDNEIEKLKKEIKKFKENINHVDLNLSNVKLKMLLLEKEYKKNLNKNNEIIYLRNLIKSIEEYLNILNPNEFENISIFEKYMLYLKKLIKYYDFLLEQNLTKKEKNEIINKIKDYMQKIKGINIRYLFQFIDILNKNKEVYYTILIHLMRLYFNEGLNFYNNGNYEQSKYFLEESINISNYNDLINKITKEKDLQDEHNDIIESCSLYLKKIQTNILIKSAEEFFEKGIYNSEQPDMDLIYLSLDQFIEALNKISGIDFKTEAKCLAKIILIEYKILRSPSINKINILINQCIKLAEIENSTNEKWYSEIIDIKKQILNNNEQIIKSEDDIITEIRNKYYSNTILDFIRYILEKYPCKRNFDNLENDFKKDRKQCIKKLCISYSPDNDENKTEEGSKHYRIINIISSLLNNYRTTLNENTLQ